MWLGHGLEFLQGLWTRPSDSVTFERSPLSFALKLHLCLADAGWAGWKPVGLPLILRSTIKPDFSSRRTHILCCCTEKRQEIGPIYGH